MGKSREIRENLGSKRYKPKRARNSSKKAGRGGEDEGATTCCHAERSFCVCPKTKCSQREATGTAVVKG